MTSETVAAKHFDRWVGVWDEIYASMPDRAPFLQSRFLAPLLQHFGSGSEIVFIGRDRSGRRFAAILVRTGFGVWSTFQPSQLPLGPLVAEPGFAWEDLRSHLFSSLPGASASVGVTQLDPALFERPSGDGATLDYIETAWVDVDQPFDAYWAARGKNLRHNVRKQRSRLSESGIEARLDCITDADGVDEAIAGYGALEAAGWKSELGTAVHAENRQGSFYRSMLAAFMRAGKGRIWRYWFGSKLVAIDLCIEGNETLVILKTTYSEGEKQFSPAFLMREEYFRTLFNEGRLRRIEFFGRRMEWHQRWTENVRILYHINFDRWSWITSMRRLRSRGSAMQARAS